jgi:putative DNA primase/helicase
MSKRKKVFYFYHLEANGKKQKNRGYDAVPYRLHEIVKADKIFILEGESKADLLASWGLAATCLDSGSKSKWHSRYEQFFIGKEIIICPDNDSAGEGYLKTIAAALHGKAKSVKVLRLPGLKEKEDILDWIKRGGGTT